ncbi:MAG: hypothetical protein BWY73_00808 [candidate division TA06 bacterium ADurb.Bin417]|uniref:Uncharacterized protein n=1 Tax=candidate division TA06 bacterium ADurb.Bin417 TaxID=1852828 RepID=A0A1V5MGR9_UNCT6|nr:MAG: hypothetical protein BWY73_00808 [candidate division TA06 bacterium ADurb.Bin417]
MRGRVVDEVTYLKDDIWRDHVREVVGHYRKAYRRWVVDDEVSGGNTAFMYLEVLRSAREAARSVDPEIKVSTSADGPWFEELIELGGRDVFDAVGGSVGGVPYWHALKLGRLKEMYNKENWVTGIFATANTFYRLNRPRDDWAGQAAAIYRQMVRCFFLQRADTVAPYIFRYNSFSATRSPDYSFFDFDGSFKAQAIGFLMAGNIFSALTPDPEPVYYPFLEYDSCVVYGFNKAGRRGYLLTGNGQRLKLDLPKSGLEILDWFENPVEPAALEGGPQEVILTLSGQPVYLYDRGAGPQRLDEAVRGAQLLPPVDGLLTGPLFLVRDGQLVRAIVTANLDSQPRSGLAAGAGRLDSSAPQANPFLTRPLENEKGAWLLNCLKTARPVRLDGNLPEWSDRSSAWMYVDWGENSPPTRRQLHILSGGHFINHRPWHDFKVGFSAGYDAENLYFAFQINDDDIAPPEQAGRGLYDGLRLRLDTRPVEDLGRAAEDEDDYLVEVKLPAPDRVNAELVSQGRRQPVTAAVGRHAHGWTVELAVPLKTLGISGSPVGRLLGLNLVASDADYNRKYQGPDQYRPEFSELIWAADNPFRLGSLYFAE